MDENSDVPSTNVSHKNCLLPSVFCVVPFWKLGDSKILTRASLFDWIIDLIYQDSLD